MADFVVGILKDVVLKELIKIAIPQTIAQSKKLLESFAADLNHTPESAAPDNSLPTAALLGLGRCGTNVCTEVARLLEEALAHNRKPTPRAVSSLDRLLRTLNMLKDTSRNPYLFQPVILLADLDQQGAVQQEITKEALVVPGYQRCRLIDLRWLFKQGCGNVPQVGQYLTRLALKMPISPDLGGVGSTPSGEREERSSKFADWMSARAFFLDTVGLNENTSRLMFFIFSTGGGTGAGMSPELGTAQQFLSYKRAFDDKHKSGEKGPHLEPSCSLGLGIMPMSVADDQRDAQSMNTGRSVANYLARLQRNRMLSEQNPVITELDLPPFNCLVLVSNEIMASGDTEKNASFEDATRQANAYISQQIFNLLVSQSLPTDYLSQEQGRESDAQASIADVMRAGGIDKNELVRLDPGDLKNSLYGVSAVGYAESADVQNPSIPDLVVRAVSPPAWNKQTESVDGISVLPRRRGEYEEFLKNEGSASRYELLDKLAEKFSLFGKAVSVVTILSVPRAELLKQATVRELRSAVFRLFPAAKIKRFAVIPEASETVALTFFVCGSAHLTEEVLDHFYRYILNCFCKREEADNLIDKVEAYFREVAKEPAKGLRSEIEGTLREVEDITEILATLPGAGALLAQKVQLETRARELLGTDELPFQSVFLTKRDMLDALDYIRDGLHFRGPTQPRRPAVV